MIALQNISKHFGNTVAVSHVSFEVKEGETLVLLGTSGSGKTTTLRMINRLIEPTSGCILINNENIFSKPVESLRRNIGYVLQGYGLFPHYTVAENIAIVPNLLKWPKDKIQNRVEELLYKLQLPPDQYRSAYPETLSGGEKQRVGLARALAADPSILLMDEPFGALDTLTKASVRKEFKELDELKKKTIILVTHDIHEAFELGDKIGLMDKGILVQAGTPEELLFCPANDFVRNFFIHQRLQLELQSVRLKSIWDKLPPVKEKAEISLESSQSLWEAMEVLARNKAMVTAFDQETGTTKSVAFIHLQAVLQK
jgi:osmoprotectant transport system ATP-binding protein